MMRRLIPLLFLLLLIGLSRLIPWPGAGLPVQREDVALSDGSLLELFRPPQPAVASALVLLPAGQPLIPGPLLELAQNRNLSLGVLRIADACRAPASLIAEAGRQLGSPPGLVAGLGDVAPLAWRWLAGQADDQARALTVGFDLSRWHCPQALPDSAAHGHWHAVWNDNPDDASARFVRRQANADSQISAYDSPAQAVLLDNLQRLLEGWRADLPLIEVPATSPDQRVALFYSGDGGWRDLDRDVATELGKLQQPVVGIDSLRYFWQPRPPAQAAADLADLMQQYRERWGSLHFVLIGFSFGADALPAIYNHLPADQRQAVETLVLLNPARTGSFEIHVQGWLGRPNLEVPSAPELARLPADKLVCIYGEEDAGESGCTLAQTPGEKLRLPGGHHYDYDYPALARRIIAAVQARRTAAGSAP